MDWLCLPRFDSPAVFARLLGTPGNGYWRIVPVAGTEVARRYRDGSFVLDTRWATPTGEATSTDFLARSTGALSNVPVSAVRRVTCTSGTIELDVELVMRFDYGRVRPWVRRRHDPDGQEVLHAIVGPDSLTLHGPMLTASGYTHRDCFHLDAGESLTWTLTWQPSHLDVPANLDVDAELAAAVQDWRAWRSAVPISGPYAEVISDSLAVLRALTLHRTGGIVAAPTASLPELIGGERNWDYRYTWLRDSAFTIEALVAFGHHHVARHWRDWLLRAIAGDPDDLQIMYGVAGERDLTELIVDHLSGYRGSKPVRIGNGAHVQYQADVIGEVMIALDQLRAAGIGEDDSSWQLQVNLLGFLEKRLDLPDHSIWETRATPHFFTHSRVMMWAAFDRGVRAVEEFGYPGPIDHWRQRRAELHDEIWSRGVRGGAFVQHYDTDAVDAALLQIPNTGFVARDSEVMLATVERIERELVDTHGFVRRYIPDGSDGLAGGEGSFLMCTFWLVEQYAQSGRREDAIRLMDQLLGVRNDLGLLAEEYDSDAGALLGNFPQAFSHLALIRAAQALS